MSASAKPTEKLFKSFLAAVLAISLCPLMPADKAQAEEAGDSGEPTDAAQVADESLDRDADSTEGSLAADNSDANLELAEESNSTEDEGATGDSNVALQAASDSKTPIVNWTKCGTCQWMIDAGGCLIIEPQSGEAGELEDWTGSEAPWLEYKSSIVSAKVKKTIIAKTTQKAFYGCESLRSVDLSGLDTSSVTSMYRMFYGCSSLSSLDLSSFDTSSVTVVYCMFEGCSRLSSLDLSSFDTSKVTDMTSMFEGCSKLASLDLSSVDTSSVTDMGGMFSGCSSLSSLDLSSFDTSNVTSMYRMFSGCSSLSSIDLGQEFAFEGAGLDRQCSLPTPRGDRLTGRWVSSADGMAYAPDDIPSNTAATYTAQVAAFTDVDYSDTSWYGDAVSYVAERGLITGYTEGVKAGQFGVGDVLTRAQLATILWRNACPDEYASYDPETAVDTTGIDGSADGMYYTAAANWAVKNGVITGFDREDGSKDFAADDDVSFEQLVTILSRLCATPDELDAAGSDLSAFADGDLASSWSRGAFAWAAAKGLVQGYDEPTGKYLRPGDPVARERVAVVLMRAFEMGIMK